MHPISILRVAMRLTPTGKRKRGTPKKKDISVDKRVKENNWTWGQVQRWSQDRPTWISLVTALCVNQHKEDYVSKLICILVFVDLIFNH